MASEVEIRAPAEQTEGTRSQILRWLKSVGDTVAENEPLIELETDKVTVEVASPGTGTLREILKQEQDEIGPGDLLGWIEAAGAAATPGGAGRSSTAGASGTAEPSGTVHPAGATTVRTQSDGEASHSAAAGVPRELNGGPGSPSESAADLGVAARNLSPAVRRLLTERGLDVSEVRGTGQGGRVTVADVIGHAGTGDANVSGANSIAAANGGAAGNFEASAVSAAGVAAGPGSGPGPAGPSHRVPHTATRKRVTRTSLRGGGRR
jgi:2-oxoglutarate dehydrogenase E2 component (dihydrolipoamide succinyltransferase)